MLKRAKPVAIALVCVVLVVGAIGAVKAAQIGAMIEERENFVPPPLGSLRPKQQRSNGKPASPRSEVRSLKTT